MTSCRFSLALVVLVVTLSGCQSGVATYQTVRLPTDDYDRTFQVTQQVLSEQFIIEQADRATGRIVSSPKAAAEPESVVGAVLDLPGTVQRARRIVTAQLSRADGTTRVSVKVQRQVAQAIQSAHRPTYDEYDPTATGAESDLYRQPEQQVGVTWKPAGSDVEMANKLLAEIERRLKRTALEPEPLTETPEKVE